MRDGMMKQLASKPLLVIGLVVAVLLTSAGGAFAQNTGTIDGRISDESEGVLPGVTITATSAATGVLRVTVTNAEGLYNLAGLIPGLYTVMAEMPGFSTTIQEDVSLPVAGTISINLTLGLAALQETVTVAGASPLIEVTQSKVSNTIRTQEVTNLPLLSRRLVALVALLPGAKEARPLHPLKRQSGSVSIGGSSGRNIVPVVDGGDNRDNIVGGHMMSFTMEGVEEFRVQTNQFSAADGRTGGAAITILTKSGTNQHSGSGFYFGRDRAMTARDIFAVRDDIKEEPYRRQQYGGSIGGPIVSSRAFYFGALELIKEQKSLTVADSVFNEMSLLAMEPYNIVPRRTISQPYNDRMYTTKLNVQMSDNHSLMVRFAGQSHTAFDGGKTQTFQPDGTSTNVEQADYWSTVAQHNWVAGSNVLNQFTLHRSHMYTVTDNTGNLGPGQDNSLFFHQHYPDVRRLPTFSNMRFPSFRVGMTSTGYDVSQDMWQFRNDLTVQLGSHALKMGGDYTNMPKFGGTCCLYWGQLRFFDDPSTILGNTNGLYPDGFATPGIVREWSEGADIRTNVYELDGTSQVKAYIQDDWRIGQRLTLNLGVRYDVDINFYGLDIVDENLTFQVLQGIGSEFGRTPRTPRKDISPRVGFAYDINGDGQKVVRGGYGLYFDGTGINTHYNIFIQSNRPIAFRSTRTNTGIGVGELATLRLGIDPLPEKPTDTENLPPGGSNGGYWFDPNIDDPRTHQIHIGYTQQLGPNTVISADVSSRLGRHDFRASAINPFIDGERRLAPAFGEAFGDPQILGPVQIQTALNRNRYNDLAIMFERRLSTATFRATYVLSGGYAYAGQIAGSAYFVPEPVIWDQPFADNEWGPVRKDERHRVVLYGVFELPWDIQVSSIFKAATARPYNATAGSDLNADGLNNDRWVDPATGQEVHVNFFRGDPMVLLDMRATKFFNLGSGQRLGVFAEFFNLFNTSNFGRYYQTNGRSSAFRTPNGFHAGGQGTYPRTLQLGTRFLF